MHFSHILQKCFRFNTLSALNTILFSILFAITLLNFFSIWIIVLLYASKYTCNIRKGKSTIPFKIKHPVHSIRTDQTQNHQKSKLRIVRARSNRVYTVCNERIFESPRPTVHVPQKVLKKNSYRSSYSTCLRFFLHLIRLNWSIIRDAVSVWTFGRIPKSTTFSFETSDLCLEKLTNLDAKGAKRSVKMWGTNFFTGF